MPLDVSIIIPAHNAAATLPDTLRSVLAQTHANWEAIVIENGSSDATEAVAREWAAGDARIRVIRSAPGVSVARNAGLAVARYPWILFLDADDWILPNHLERLTTELANNPSLDAAHGGWRRVGADGSVFNEGFGPADTDLFPRFARTCVLTIHCGLTRKSLIDAVGGFDATLRTCEDWDLWQRVARAGCRFGAVHEALACYRTRDGSASMNAAQLVADSRRVIERGFSADPRVPYPKPEHANGATGDDKLETLLYTVAWAAGLCLGGGGEAAALLDHIEPSTGLTLDPTGVAGCIHCCAMLPFGLPTSSWADKFDQLDVPLRRFLQRLESHTGQSGLARSSYQQLARLALEEATRARPFTAGNLHAVDIDISAPIPDFEQLPETVERLHCLVRVEGERLGTLELPVIDGAVPAEVLADAIAAEFAWPILGRFFAVALYPKFEAAKAADGWRVARDGVPLGSRLAGNGTLSWSEAHNEIGWTVFLQEAWGAPRLASAEFYASAPDRREFADPVGAVSAGPRLLVELSEPLPPAWRLSGPTTIVLTVAGVPITQIAFGKGRRTISARAVRAALTTEAGFELCCACVREGLLGRSLSEPKPLRARLAERARERKEEKGSIETEDQAKRHAWIPRYDGPCGSSASRRALLPRGLWPEIAADVARRAPLTSPQTARTSPPTRLLYRPELFCHSPEPEASPALTGHRFEPHSFDTLFRERRNPWHYETDYEQTKYTQTLELLPRPSFPRVLELACAEGHFTTRLAPRCTELCAADISPTALRRAAERCRGQTNIRFLELDLLRDELPGQFDLIVCSEVLYYTGTIENLRRVVAKITRALRPGGWLATAHAHLVVDEPHRSGFDWDLPFGAKRISAVLQAQPGLSLLRDLRTPLYRVQLYRREPRWRPQLKRREPKRILLPQPTELPPDVAPHALWRGGYPRTIRPDVAVTPRLPILMYHRVAPGSDSPARYCVSPDAFDAQLRALASRGFRCVSLDEWRRAMIARRPLAGRCVVLTFDDGYRDFLDHAWPWLQRHGFTATIFLPTDFVGGESCWDARLGETFPLLSWDDVRRLHGEGVEFGSHSAGHVALAGQPPTEILREALRSRSVLETQLGDRVNAFAYPYGDCDRVVERLVGSCGYIYGLTCEERLSELSDRLLALPRLEIRGDMDLEDFVAMLPAE